MPPVFAITLSCKPLSEHREFRHTDPDLLVQKVRLQFDRWKPRLSALGKSSSVERLNGQHAADVMTEWAQLQLSRCEGILTQPRRPWSLTVWESLKIFHEFRWKHEAVEGVRYSAETGEPESIDVLPALRPVFKQDRQFEVQLNLLDRLMPSRAHAKLKVADDAYASALNHYEVAQLDREQTNAGRAVLFHQEKQAYAAASRCHLPPSSFWSD